MAHEREIIGDATGNDAATIHPYQAGRHKPAVWQDGGDFYVVAKRAPVDGHAGMNWRPAKDQTTAARYKTTLWERVESKED